MCEGLHTLTQWQEKQPDTKRVNNDSEQTKMLASGASVRFVITFPGRFSTSDVVSELQCRFNT